MLTLSQKYTVRPLHLSKAYCYFSLLLFSVRERLFITPSLSTSSQVAVIAWREERCRNKNDSDIWKTLLILKKIFLFLYFNVITKLNYGSKNVVSIYSQLVCRQEAMTVSERKRAFLQRLHYSDSILYIKTWFKAEIVAIRINISNKWSL